MTLDLYYTPRSAPARAVLLGARALDVALDLKDVNLFEGEARTEEYMKMNPQHTVPLLVDGELCLAESAAILMYLADVYGKDDSLYPRDPIKRAMVNQRLFFNVGSLFPRVVNAYVAPVVFQGKPINEEAVAFVDDSFNALESFLNGNDWVAGEAISIADYCIVSLVSTVEAIGYDVGKYENVAAWLARCKEVMEDYDDLNQTGVDMFATTFAERLSQAES